MPVPPQTAPAPSAVPQHALSPAKASVGHAAAPGPALRATWRTSQPAPDSGGFLCGTVTPAFTVWLGSAKGLIYLCSARGEIIRSFPAHNGRIHGLLPLWPLVWSVGEDGAVHIWDSNTSPPRLISSLMAHKAPLRFISSVFVPSEGYMVMTGDATGVVCVWPVQPQAEPLARVTMPGQEPLQSMCQVTDAAWFGCRRGIHIFALQSLTLRRSIPVNAGVNRVLFVPGDGVWVATNSNIIVFSPEGNQLRTIEGHGSRVFALHFSPIFSTVFSGAFDKSVVAWDLRTHERVATLDGRHKDGVRVVLECAFGPQDHTLVTAGDADDMTVTCWSLTHAP